MTIEIPDNIVTELAEALGQHTESQQTNAQYIKTILKSQLKAAIQNLRTRKAEETARNAIQEVSF
jgi:hypothetical protein